ncbi:MAG: glycogen/starch synthase [Sandaracinaceae bacterium]|jgi:starch synthase|nr:glycogen/starch synthase [Sandaracinaceae bacterium]
MDVLVVTPELVHYRGSSSLAESAGALSKALRGLGHKVNIVSPLWASIDPAARHLARRLVRLEVASGGATKTFALFEGKTTAGVDVSFLSEPSLFPADASAEEEGAAGAARWGGFARAVIALLKRRVDQGEGLPEVIHLLGWQVGVLPCILADDPALSAIPTVFTVHDLSRKGSFERAQLGELGLSAKHFGIEGVEFFGKISTLKAGLQFASRVVAPSPSLASRFLVEAGGAGLEGVLRARGRAFSGVMDGVDASLWNPATDPHLDVRYDAIEVGSTGVARLRNKAAVQLSFELPVRDDVALTLAVLRDRADERAFHAILPRIVKNDVQMIVLSSGPLHEDVADLARRFPDRIGAKGEAPSPMLHRLLGAADLCVLASLDDPFGVLALEAQRYGALPVGRADGLVADAVVDADAQLSSGTGFTFEEASAEALFGAIMRASTAFRDRARFRAAQQRAMLRDHSWDRSARLLERVYRGLRGAPTETATA